MSVHVIFLLYDSELHYKHTDFATVTRENMLTSITGITLNYAIAQLVNFDSIKDIILGTDARDVIIVRNERKIKRKKRMCDGSSLSSADMVTIMSEPKEKIYRVSFHKRRHLDGFDSVPFSYIKDEQSGSTSQFVS
jgi:hypothetical protein